MNNEENLLIIGNGFDLAHDLPTKYIDFLEFSRYVLKLKDSNGRYDSKALICEVKDENIKNFFMSNGHILNELIRLLDNNIWIFYFENRMNSQKENWIDFESEISDVIKLLEKAREEYYRSVLMKTDSINTMEMKVYCEFQNCMEMNDVDDMQITANTFVKIKERLLKDLEKLTKALEIYLGDYVGKIKVKFYSEDILKINPQYILSFNYTNTYDKIYHMNYDIRLYCYIHGKIRENKKEDCNIILGIDEYMDEQEREKNIEFIEFQKYYQRVQKKTIFEFNEWKQKLGSTKLNIYIFGHSLDITDKDIIKSFIEDEKYKINIYYKDKKAYGCQIANLVKLIGKDKLLKKLENQIKFIKQTDMKKIENSSFDIYKDINKMSKISELDNQAIHDFLEKISTKIKEQDTKYFKNQENIIHLFSEMDKWELINKDDEKLMLEIAKKIPNIELFQENEWFDVWPDGKIYTPNNVRKFINKINAINKEKKNVYRISKDNLWEQYETRTDIRESEFDKLMKKYLKCLEDKKVFNKIKHIVINNIVCARKVLEKIKINENISHCDKIRIVDLLKICDDMEYIESSGMITAMDNESEGWN